MPIYVYNCASCNSDIEKRQGFNDAPLTTCEACGGDLRRVLQPVGIIFKGSGFYVTDSRGGNGANGKSASTDKNGTSGEAGSAAKDTTSGGGEAGSTTTTKTESSTKSESSTTSASPAPSAS